MLYGNGQPQKDKTEVEVTFLNGCSMRGYFYLRQAQRVADLLNDSREFIPFEDVASAIRLVNKATIVEVKPTDPNEGKKKAGLTFI